MSDALLWIVVLLGIVNAGLLVAVLVRSGRGAEGSGALIRDELRQGREEARVAARESREELSASLKSANDTIAASLTSLSEIQRAQLDGMSKQIKDLTESSEKSLERVRHHRGRHRGHDRRFFGSFSSRPPGNRGHFLCLPDAVRHSFRFSRSAHLDLVKQPDGSQVAATPAR